MKKLMGGLTHMHVQLASSPILLTSEERDKELGTRLIATHSCASHNCVTHSITQSNSKGLHRIPVWLLYHDKYKQCNDYNITNGMETLTNRVIVEPKYPTNHIVTARKGQREKDFKNSRFSKLSSYWDRLNIVFIQVWVS